jgi:hypothetical protein
MGLARGCHRTCASFAIGFENCRLYHVFAIQYRARHAGAVAVQPWAQMRDSFQKRDVPCLEEAESFDVRLALISTYAHPDAVRIRAR